MRSGRLVVVGTLVVSVAMGSAMAMAESKMVKAAKDAGLPAKNCEYCHTVKTPKKETFKPEQLNARGKWMADEKKKRNAPKSDVSWLKDYPGGKE